MTRVRIVVPFALIVVAWLGDSADARKRGRRRGRVTPVPALTQDGLPNVMSASAVVVDLDRDEELYTKQPDDVRFIASVGKLFVALVVRDKAVPLEGKTTITEEDRKYASGGARSRLPVGKTFTNHDLLRAMLIASDNRAVTAVARAAGLSPETLIDAVNEKAKALGLSRTRFEDPTGLNGNVSTTREVLVVLRETMADPVLAEIMRTSAVTLRSHDEKPIAVDYINTNQSLRVNRYVVLAGKTGYTDEARYCLAIAAEIAGRRIGMVFLGAEGELTRFADFNRVAGWMEGGGHERQRAVEGSVGASVDPPPAPVAPRVLETTAP